MSQPFKNKLVLGLGMGALALALSGARIEWPPGLHASPIYSEARSSTVANPLAGVAGAQDLSNAFVAVSDQLSPAVVNIYTSLGGASQARRHSNLPPEFEEQLEQFFGNRGMPFEIPDMKREALGSGFVINASEGYIVTNAHVVRMAGQNVDEIMVKLIGEENEKGHLAKIVGADEVSDVALLKLVDKIPGLKSAALGDSDKARVGEWVLAIGNPYGHTNTVTQGIVSALGRNLEGARSDFLQTSASINPGNSGGPLINLKGEVIGINSAMDPRAQNIGFAIPINTAKTIITQLVDGGRVHRAWMGIGIEDVNEKAAGLLRLKEAEGVLVKEVIANAPAAKAGIEAYDVIRKINGQPVKNTRDLFKSMGQLTAGNVAEIEVLRGGTNKTVKVQLADQPPT